MICCVTGHRPKGFPFPHDRDCVEYMDYRCKLDREVELLAREGYRDFITGMADGADLDFAETVIELREAEGYITLEAALPYPIRPTKKVTEYIDHRDTILLQCDRKTVVSTHYYRGCMQARNRYMVDKADIVLAIWNGTQNGGTWDTIQYALSKGKEVRYLKLGTFWTDILTKPLSEDIMMEDITNDEE